MEKIFITAEDLLLDSYRLSMKIYESDFRPDFIVGLWRGGSPVGIAVQDCLDYLGIKTDHISIRTSYRGQQSYRHMIENAHDIRIHGSQYLIEKMNAHNKLLIIDDVYSSGHSVEATIKHLNLQMRKNIPSEIKVAATWYRPGSNPTSKPDFYVNETDKWLVLPYELNGLSEEDIAQHKPYVKKLADEINVK